MSFPVLVNLVWKPWNEIPPSAWKSTTKSSPPEKAPLYVLSSHDEMILVLNTLKLPPTYSMPEQTLLIFIS